MDFHTQKMLMVVICFSLVTKLFRDINTLYTGIPFLFKILFAPINVPILLYITQIILFTLTFVGALIVPTYLLAYFMKKGRITIGYDLMQHMFKPQLYCAVLGIVQLLLSSLFSGLISIVG